MIEWALIFYLSGTPPEIDDTVRGFSTRDECAKAARAFVKAHPRFQFLPDDQETMATPAVLVPTVGCVEDQESPFSSKK